MKIAYVENNGGDNYIVLRNHQSPFCICEAPKDENGKYILDIDIIDLVNVLDPQTDEVVGKKAVVNETKKVNKDATNETAASNRAWEMFRLQRDRKLLECDWTQGQDAQPTLTASQVVAWAEYRQQLRDLPANTPDPSNPSWPVEPS